MNYYEILNIPVAYDVDADLLTRNYFSLQRNGDRVDVRILNEAYNTLKSDIKRAEHFLSVKGIVVERISTALAMKMFIMREQYESLNNREDRIKFQSGIKKQVKRLASELKNYEEDLNKFVEIFGELKFLSSFLEKERLDVYSRD